MKNIYFYTIRLNIDEIFKLYKMNCKMKEEEELSKKGRSVQFLSMSNRFGSLI